MRIKDGNKAGLITHLANEGEVFLKSQMGDFASGSVKGVVVTSKLRIRQEMQHPTIDKYIYYETNVYLILVRLRGK